MQPVTPKVWLIGAPFVVERSIREYLDEIGASHAWIDRVTEADVTDGEQLAEFAGRLCYRSFELGLNPNVTKTRNDSAEYITNILNQRHGSVLEHSYYVFLLHGVSRVLTHEWVRHRVGISISQESMRYVRLEEIPFWMPDWTAKDPELVAKCREHVEASERFMGWLNERLGVTDPAQPFSHKKKMTSFVRRFCPSGVATSMVWGANLRSLRHVIEMRTDPAAEEEARVVASLVFEAVRRQAPNVFADYMLRPDAGVLDDDHRRKV